MNGYTDAMASQFNTDLYRQQMLGVFNQQAGMQQQAQMGGLGQLAGLGGMFPSGFDHRNQVLLYDHPYRSSKGLARRKFMQRTRAGFRARKITEVLFWIVAAFTLIGAIMVPVAVKAMTFFWQWALT